MSADDYLHPVQFAGKADKSDADRDKRAKLNDAKGADEDSEFGYSEYDMSDAQWNRKRHSDKPEVF